MPAAEQKLVADACWSCATPVDAAQLFCTNCGKVLPASTSADYFQVFSLPRRLNIDTPALERAFYRLSRKLHPDMYARASEDEQEWSLRNASLLNDAYRTLKDPISRTEYLLRLEGVEIEQEGKQNQDRVNPSRVPPDLLEEVFELNMQLEEMRMTRKSGADDPDLRRDLLNAEKQFESQLAEVDDSLRAQWEEWDDASTGSDSTSWSEQRRQNAKQQLVALLDRRRYIRNLVRDVKETLDS
jgi:molecular chaperone HscB